jgi:hypothetical protein
MGIHWLGYDNGIVRKVERNTFVATVQVNYVAYIETDTPNYRLFCALTKLTYFVIIIFILDSQRLRLLLNSFELSLSL